MTRWSSRNRGASRNASGSPEPKSKPPLIRPSYAGPPDTMSAVSSLSWFVISAEPLSVDEALAFVGDPGAGGTCVFVGTVRDRSEAGDVTGLHYEAWDELATERLARDRRGDARWLAPPAGGDPASDRGPRDRGGLGRRGLLGAPPRRSVRGLPSRDRTSEGGRADLEEGGSRLGRGPSGSWGASWAATSRSTSAAPTPSSTGRGTASCSTSPRWSPCTAAAAR